MRMKNSPLTVDPLELHAAADGPVHGVGADAELLLQLVDEVEGDYTETFLWNLAPKKNC